MSRTRRSNEQLKRHHWKAARAARRGRFAHGFMDWEEEDVVFRRSKRLAARGGSRTVLDFEGHKPVTGWLTADKSHLRWKLKWHREQFSPGRAQALEQRLGIRT